MADDFGQLRQELRNRRLAHWLRSVTERATAIGKVLAVLVGSVLVVALEIPWLRDPLKRAGFEDISGIGATVIVFILALLFFDIRRLAARDSDATGERHFADPMDVYPILIERIRRIKRKDDKVLDVLGMTLYTAWPTTNFWLNRSDLDGWKIRLCAVYSDSEELARVVPAEWFEESRSNLTSVVQRKQALERSGRNVTLEAYYYDFMPVIHGFRIGNGDLFYSILSWQDDGKIGRETYSYHFVPGDDDSTQADAIRSVFESWFRRGCSRPWLSNGLSRNSLGVSPESTSDGVEV